MRSSHAGECAHVLRMIAFVLLAFAVAEPAFAAPRLSIESVVLGEAFGSGGRCFGAGSVLSASGSGFAPGRVVRVDGERIRVGRDGRFGFQVTVDEPRRAQQRVTLRARQVSRADGRRRIRQAALRYWAALEGVDVPGWNTDGREAIAVPGKVERARFGGFAGAVGRPLYVHYLLEGRQVFAQRVARLRGPCGAADFRLVQFPFSPVEMGAYRIDFGTRATVDPGAGAGYRRVRVGEAPPPLPAQTAPLFTVAGNGTDVPAPDGAPATASGLASGSTISARRSGGFLVTDEGRVRAVDTLGRISTVAGTGRPGSTGDGGPATAAQIDPSAVAELPDGGFLIGQCEQAGRPAYAPGGSVRRVLPDGRIITIVGRRSGGRAPRDGRTALDVQLPDCPSDVASDRDGRVIFSVSYRVWSVGPDGVLRLLAGSGDVGETGVDGGPARRTPIQPDDVAVLADGSMLLADSWNCRVWRLADDRLVPIAGDGSEGRRNDDGARAADASVCPRAVAAAPGGGFYVADHGYSRIGGSEPRLRLVTADGRIATVAGTGRFAPDPSRGEELRGDGIPGPRADLHFIRGVGVLADGGVVFTEGNEMGNPPSVVRYVTPPHGGMLGVAVRRDRDRIFERGAPAHTTVSLSAPAEVTVTVRQGAKVVATLTRALAAGDTRLEVPSIAPAPHVVSLSARDADGRVAEDRAAILPRGWLAEPLARNIAQALVFTATDASSSSGDGVGGCLRFAAGRVDCVLNPERRCDAVLTVRLGRDTRLRWGTYRCPVARARTLEKRLRALRRRHFSCEISETSCPPPLFGRVADRWLVPRD